MPISPSEAKDLSLAALALIGLISLIVYFGRFLLGQQKLDAAETKSISGERKQYLESLSSSAQAVTEALRQSGEQTIATVSTLQKLHTAQDALLTRIQTFDERACGQHEEILGGLGTLSKDVSTVQTSLDALPKSLRTALADVLDQRQLVTAEDLAELFTPITNRLDQLNDSCRDLLTRESSALFERFAALMNSVMILSPSGEQFKVTVTPPVKGETPDVPAS